MSNVNAEPAAPYKPWGMETKTFCLLMHISQLIYFLPPAGIVIPIVMWALHKDRDPVIDAHGKNIINFIISMVIYLGVSIILTIVVIGFFLFIPLVICGIVFPILAGIKANQGIVWKYPIAISFLK